MSKFLCRSILVALLVLSTSALTFAQQKKVTYTGTLNSIASSAPFWSGLSLGDAFTVTVYYTMSPAFAFDGSDFGQYQWREDDFSSITAQFGQYTFSSDVVEARVLAGNGAYGFSFMNAYPIQAEGLDLINAALQVNLQSLSNVTTGPHLEDIGNYPLSSFYIASFSLGGYFDGYTETASVGGNFSSYNVETVPEPSTWALLGLGALMLRYAARRRRSV